MDIKHILIKHEGMLLKPYKCTKGKLTIGIGRNLDDNGITEQEAMLLLENDIKRCEEELKKVFDNYLKITRERQCALISLIFNLGLTRFLKFKKTIELIKLEKWEEASEEVLISKWATQVPLRANEISKMLKGKKC
jgi:lysozyme